VAKRERKLISLLLAYQTISHPSDARKYVESTFPSGQPRTLRVLIRQQAPPLKIERDSINSESDDENQAGQPIAALARPERAP
jgi:hypothetical protein